MRKDTTMRNTNPKEKNIERLPLYFTTWFIAIIMLIAGFIHRLSIFFAVPIAIIGIVLIVKQSKIIKNVYDVAQSIIDVDQYKKNAESDIEISQKNSIREIQSATDNAQTQLRDLEHLIADKKIALNDIENSITDAKNELSQLTNEIQLTYISPFSFNKNITSEEYKNKLTMLRTKEKEYMQSDACVKGSKFIDDGSLR